MLVWGRGEERARWRDREKERDRGKQSSLYFGLAVSFEQDAAPALSGVLVASLLGAGVLQRNVVNIG